MSQPMSEREIEDVLASVRRLVAQEERRTRLAPLVLTPEMRVSPAGIAHPPPEGGTPAETPAPEAPAGTFAAESPAATAAEPAAGQTSAEPAAEHTGAGLPQTVGRDHGLPAAIDDEALQALVAQIVRDELHGRLGERITLAVRKLVRNEIARALDEERRK